MQRPSKTRIVFSLALLGTVGLGTALGLVQGAGAQSAHGKVTPREVLTAATAMLATTTSTTAAETPQVACAKTAEKIGYKSTSDSGTPSNSTPTELVCTAKGKQVLRYGDTAITYVAPNPSSVAAGRLLYEVNCASCHMPNGVGSAAAPSLLGVGPASVNFWITTGRMPAATSAQIQAQRKAPKLTVKQANEIAAFVNSLDPSAPYIPIVNLKGANLSSGSNLFALNCAACHTITGAGDALAYGTMAPSLHAATARQVAEAMRIGPGNMPVFSGNLTDAQVRNIVAYVTEKIQHPTNPGGFGLGGIGPVTEGFIGLLLGVGLLALITFWIGDRA